jgi:formate-dependent nitrite reductase membrane component NrfD
MIPLHNGTSLPILTLVRGFGNGLTDSAVAVLMTEQRVRFEQSVTKHKWRYHPFGVPG